MGDGDGNRSAAGAQVEHRGRVGGGQGVEMAQGEFHQQFGIRAGNEHIGGHFEAQAEKLSLSQHIGQGFAFAQTRRQGVQQGLFGRVKQAFWMGGLLGAIPAEHGLDEGLCVQPGQAAGSRPSGQIARRCHFSLLPRPPVARPDLRCAGH